MKSYRDHSDFLPRVEGWPTRPSKPDTGVAFVAPGPARREEAYHGPSHYAETVFVSILLALGLLGLVLLTSVLLTGSVRRRRRTTRLESKLLPKGQRIIWK